MEMHSFQELLNKNKHLAEVKNEGLDAINTVRKQHGKEPYLPNEKIDVACGAHVLWMSTKGMHHNESWFSGKPGDRLTKAGFQWTSYGENISEGQEDVEAAVNIWMSDFGHRANNLSNNMYASVYSATAADGTKYWCLDCASGE